MATMGIDQKGKQAIEDALKKYFKTVTTKAQTAVCGIGTTGTGRWAIKGTGVRSALLTANMTMLTDLDKYSENLLKKYSQNFDTIVAAYKKNDTAMGTTVSTKAKNLNMRS